MPDVRRGRTDRQLAAAGFKECPLCFLCYTTRGFSKYYTTCAAWKAGRDEVLETDPSPSRPESDGTPVGTLGVLTGLDATLANISWLPLPKVDQTDAAMVDRVNSSNTDQGNEDDLERTMHEMDQDGGTPEPAYEEGSIFIRRAIRPGRIDQHSGAQARVQPRRMSRSYTGNVPWRPFIRLADFKFAQLALETGINADQIDRHLAIHHLASDCPLTLRSAEELHRIQARAEHLLAPYQPLEYSVPLRPSNPNLCLEFTVWTLPLKEWLLELVLNLEIQKDLHFDAVQKLRMINGAWVRFVDEPWTADDWAATQEALPEDGLPLNIILYADKAIASSWGSKKLYPVIARLANLPRAIRNSRGNGIGSGRVVGLLPVIDKAPNGVGGTTFANFKCNVWHRGMEKMLDTIRMESKFGWAVELELHHALNLEKKLWRLFPNVPILAADLEEHSREVQSIMEKVKHMNIGQGDEVLSEHSYRPVQSAFAILGERTDVYSALSYDTLHNDDLGRWGGHLWPLLKEYIAKSCPLNVGINFEARIDGVPPWADMNHFPGVLDMQFSDGTKFEDLLHQQKRWQIQMDPDGS
ncbi:hypothetical protein FRC09_012193 [Ceratobasidium sp. 395]|nr:hypothetical protein FRC09_012193 [Ceratobasidium sp. 395]